MAGSDRSAPFALDIAMRVDGRDALLAVGGEVDAVSVPLLERALCAVIDVGCRTVTIEAGDVTFLDSRGVHALLRTITALTEQGGRLVVHSPSTSVSRILTLMGLTETIPIQHLAASGASSAACVAEPGREAGPPSADVLDEILGALVTLAAARITGASGASVTLLRHGRLVTAASTGETCTRLDEHQYDSGRGPCVDASTHGQPFLFDCSLDDRRWPSLAPILEQHGMSSILSTPLIAGDGPVGALNLYACHARAFEADSREMAAAFAADTSALLHRRAP